MKRILLFIFLLVLCILHPSLSKATKTCQLPCSIQTEDWNISLKLLSYSSSDISSLWFRIENTDSQKESVTVEAFTISPIFTLPVPLFEPITIPVFNSEREYIFQHYYEPTNAKQLQINLTWNTYNKTHTETVFIELS
jgi:hypothetical protein